jgi:hypothetical protein
VRGWAPCAGVRSTPALTEVNRVTGAVAKGDLSQRMALEIDGRPLKGAFLRSGKTVNTITRRCAASAPCRATRRSRSSP